MRSTRKERKSSVVSQSPIGTYRASKLDRRILACLARMAPDCWRPARGIALDVLRKDSPQPKGFWRELFAPGVVSVYVRLRRLKEAGLIATDDGVIDSHTCRVWCLTAKGRQFIQEATQ